MKIVFFYTLYATLATVANILAQDVLSRLYSGPGHLLLCVAFGTCVGLVVKYWLDKRYIFRCRTPAVSLYGATFVIYAVVGLMTTIIFWGFELAFHVWFDGVPSMRYLGGCVGLILGYWTKYQLDKRYVFSEATA